MSTIHSPSPTRRGSAMVAAALLVIILASAGVAMITTAVGHNEEQGHRRDEIVLLAAAESAFNAAYDYAQRNSRMCTHPAAGHELMRNGNCFAGGAEAFSPVALSQANLLEGGLTATAFNGATISATVTLLNDVDPTKWGDETYRIKAEAVIGDFAKDPQHSRRRFVEAVVRPPVPGTSTLFANAMYALEGYKFFGSAETDSYDSSAGVYNDAVHGDRGDIASETWLTVENPAIVRGVPTPNLQVDLPLVNYTAPPGATKIWTGGSYANGIDANYTFAGPGTYQCAALDLQNVLLTIPVGGTVTLYVDGPITFFKGRVLFKGDDSDAAQRCRLRIYQQDNLGGTVSINGNTNIGELSDGRSSRPRQLQVYSDYSGDISLNGNATVSMVLFAPRATVSHMNGTFDFLGSLLTKSFDGAVNGSFSFVYDTSLGAPDPDDFQLPPVLRIVGWRTSTGPTAANDPTLEP